MKLHGLKVAAANSKLHLAISLLERLADEEG
jgi:hypothetical protein